ncbi:MAG: hypothetical protein ACPG21_08740 [Crocinitomicaceae bacterium]
MGDASKYDMLMGVLYVSAALFLLIVSYLILLKKLKRGKMIAKSEINLTTSRYDNYKNSTQFLLEVSHQIHVDMKLLNENEEPVRTILGEMVGEGQTIIDFNVDDLSDGIYYISLKTENQSILRKIRVYK